MGIQRIVVSRKELKVIMRLCEAYEIFRNKDLQRPLIRFGNSSIKWDHLANPTNIELEIEKKSD